MCCQYSFKDTESVFHPGLCEEQVYIRLHLSPNDHARAYHSFPTDWAAPVGCGWGVGYLPRVEPVTAGPRVTALEKFCNKY